MISRTVIRNSDVGSVRDAQRPINDAFRRLDEALQALPRRLQTWIRLTMPIGSAGQLIRAPEFPVSAVLVLSAVVTNSAGSAISAAPWLNVEPVEGSTAQLKITNAYGLPTSGVVDVLVEFVENMAAEWPRTNVTGGSP